MKLAKYLMKFTLITGGWLLAGSLGGFAGQEGAPAPEQLLKPVTEGASLSGLPGESGLRSSAVSPSVTDWFMQDTSIHPPDDLEKGSYETSDFLTYKAQAVEKVQGLMHRALEKATLHEGVLIKLPEIQEEFKAAALAHFAELRHLASLLEEQLEGGRGNEVLQRLMIHAVADIYVFLMEDNPEGFEWQLKRYHENLQEQEAQNFLAKSLYEDYYQMLERYRLAAENAGSVEEIQSLPMPKLRLPPFPMSYVEDPREAVEKHVERASQLLHRVSKHEREKARAQMMAMVDLLILQVEQQQSYYRELFDVTLAEVPLEEAPSLDFASNRQRLSQDHEGAQQAYERYLQDLQQFRKDIERAQSDDELLMLQAPRVQAPEWQA